MKRKSKLFLSLASMMFAVALLCFGVYAALSVSYTISGSVVYEVKDVFVNIQTSVYVSTLGTLTDETQLRTNMTKLQNFEEVTNIADTGYTYSLNTYGDGVPPDEAEDIKINYGSYQANTQGFAYYIVVNIKNYGTEQVGVSVQNNINAQDINSIVAVTKSTNIDARGENDYSEKNIVIALALDDATKSVSNVEFNVPITISRTLVEEHATLINEQSIYYIGGNERVTLTSNIIGEMAFYNFTLSDVPQNVNWLNLEINASGIMSSGGNESTPDTIMAFKGSITDESEIMDESMYVGGMMGGDSVISINISNLDNSESNNSFTLAASYYYFNGGTSTITLGWSQLKEEMGLDDFVCMGATYTGTSGLLGLQLLHASGIIDDPLQFINEFLSSSSIIIPQDVTKIGSYAFYNCSSLSEITIPQSVTTIGERAFDSCSSLTEITIPQNVETIGEYAFAICSSLNTIVIDNLDIANAITSSTSQGDLLHYLKPGTGVVKVKCSGLDKVTSTYLTNTSYFTATYQDGYAVFTKK